MTIGERIKARRIELGYSVDELAQKLGKNRATVYRYENGDIKDMPTQVLEPLASALETTPAELMGWSLEVEKFASYADAFNARHPELPTLREKSHLEAYRKLREEYKSRIDTLTDALLAAQEAEQDLLLAAHARTDAPTDKADVEHDISVVKQMDEETK